MKLTRPAHALGVTAMLILGELWAASVSGQPGPTAAGAVAVGVVDFYAPTPLHFFTVDPERFAADDLSVRLAHTAGGRLMVIPRPTMAQAEGALRWHNADVLHFERLRELAGAAGADRLVVGWIPLLSVEAGGGFRFRHRDLEPGNAVVNLVIQVFDAAQGRLVAERRYGASVAGVPERDLLVQRVLDQALGPAVPSLLDLLSVQSSLPRP